MLRRRSEEDPRPALQLSHHREGKGISLDDLMAQTKLSRRFLESIERGEYEELPGGIFTISYLRQYAQATGYNVERLLEHYRAMSDGEDGAAGCARRADSRQGWLRLILG